MRIACLLALALAACGGETADSGGGVYADAGAGAPSSDAGPQHCLSSNECPTGYTCNDVGICEAPGPTGDAGTPPPETEYTFSAPVHSDRYVYVAMTSEDELARIDGQTLGVTATHVGHAPSVIAAIPGSDGAVVLDQANGTASIVHPGSGSGDTVDVLPTLPNLNELSVDPTGHYAVIWFDLSAAGGFTGVGSFQDVTILALPPSSPKAVNLTVGFRPRAVEFDSAGHRAYVVTQDGVSVIDLAAATQGTPMIVPPIPVAAPGVPPEDLEVQVVATGEWAVVRQAGVAGLRVVNVGSQPGQSYQLSLASEASDIDLAPDGTRVYAVLRDAKQLAIVDIPGDAMNPAGVDTVDLSDATLGQLTLSADGKRALLYTNASLDPRITLVQLDQPGYPHVTWPLEKAVRAVAIAPTSDTALVLHAKVPGDPTTATNFDDFLAESYGYSMLDLASGFAKLQLTPVDPGPFAYAPDGTKLYVALDGGDAVSATRQLQIVATRTGVVTTEPLGSPPTAVGILPGAAQAFVAQRHPLGRVSFFDLVSDAVRTVTGFDLNSQIVN